jgi:hypothetical protein
MKPHHERFGFTEKQWDVFKAEAREILIEIARQRGMITYGDLAGRMTTIQVEPHDMVLWYIIGDVSRNEDAAKRGMLSVVVVHKYGDMEPGFGFYDLAKELGRYVTNRTECFVEELHKVHAVWSVNQSKE